MQAKARSRFVGGGVRARTGQVPPRRVNRWCNQAAALRVARRRRLKAPRPRRPTPISVRVAGSGTTGVVFTPSRNTVGGRLVVLPLSPQARNVSTALLPPPRSADVGVKSMLTLFQLMFCCDGVFISVESTSRLLAVPVTVHGFVEQSTPIPPTPRNT